ncbi:MAG: hypothetical protein ABL907_16075 [Hyphomicrobium sp.]
MSRTPCRLTQLSCVAMVALGLLPWALLVGALLLRAIDSTLPLTMSLLAWVVLLVPVWVGWFAVIAWRQRDETALPAVLMAAPFVVVTAMFMMLPSGVAAP